MPFYVFAAKLCPPNVEASMFALFMVQRSPRDLILSTTVATTLTGGANCLYRACRIWATTSAITLERVP